MNKIRDFQRKRVYDWERSQPWFKPFVSYLTQEQVRSVIERLDKVFKTKTKIFPNICSISIFVKTRS